MSSIISLLEDDVNIKRRIFNRNKCLPPIPIDNTRDASFKSYNSNKLDNLLESIKNLTNKNNSSYKKLKELEELQQIENNN
jgi:hypothetical protein